MSNSSTGVKDDTRPEVPSQEFEVEIENPVQAFGYVRVYRAIRDAVGMDAAYLYGVLEDYAQMSHRNRRLCTPTHDDLAKHMSTSTRTIERHVATLRNSGFIGTRKLPNGRMAYTVKMPPAKNGGRVDPPAKNGGSQPPNVAGAIKQEQVSKPEEKENTKEKETPTNKPQDTGTKKLGTTQETLARVGLSKEMTMPYWQGELGMARKRAFQLIFEMFPKQGEEQSSMAAWRQTIATRLDPPATEEKQELWNAMFMGVQWFARKMADEKRERQYINGFPKWIREELWNDAPAELRARKVS